MKRLTYILSKWMFKNRWTGDRIFPVLADQREDSDVGGTGKQGEGNRGSVQGNGEGKIEEI